MSYDELDTYVFDKVARLPSCTPFVRFSYDDQFVWVTVLKQHFWTVLDCCVRICLVWLHFGFCFLQILKSQFGSPSQRSNSCVQYIYHLALADQSEITLWEFLQTKAKIDSRGLLQKRLVQASHNPEFYFDLCYLEEFISLALMVDAYCPFPRFSPNERPKKRVVKRSSSKQLCKSSRRHSRKMLNRFCILTCRTSVTL